MSSFGRTLMNLAGTLFLLAAVAAQAQVDVPTPALPAAGATSVPLTAHFVWRPIVNAASYEIELAYDANFEQLAYANGVTTAELDVDDLWDDTTYYWHVRAIDSLDSISAWSPVRSFHTVVTGAPRPTSPVDGAGNLPMEEISLNFAYPTNPPSGFEVMHAFDPSFRGGVSTSTAPAARSARITSLPYDTTIYWRVRVASSAAAGPGEWSRTMKFSTVSRPPLRLGECTPLLPPNGITLEDVLVSSAWIGPSIPGATVHYEVRFSVDPTMQDGVLGFDDVDTSALRVVLPDGSATWYWQVRALSTVDGMLDGPWSALSRFTIEPRVESGLGTPSLLLPPNLSSGHGAGVVLVWDSVSAAEAYEVAIGRDSTWDESDTTISTTNRLVRIGGLLPDTSYYWHVRALASRGTNRGSWSRSFVFSTGSVDAALPAAPVLVSPANEGVNLDPVLGFQWTPATGATVHILQISDDSTFATGARELATFDGAATAALDEGRRWWWRVRGVNDAGPGPWSSIWTFTTSTTPTSVPDRTRIAVESNRVVPTPATTQATVMASIAPGAGARLVIASIGGEVVHEQQISADASGSVEVTLAVDELPPGVYRCRITTSAGEITDLPLLVTR